MNIAPPIVEALEAFLLDAEDDALDLALDLARAANLAPVVLLEKLPTLRGDPARKRQAVTAVRRSYGLPLIPGPPCRSSA